MVGSCQPSFSKWWWIGAIRNTRLPVRLNTATCSITDKRFEHEQTADDGQHDFVLGRHRHRAEQAAQRQRAGIAHEHARGRRIVPKKAERGAEQRAQHGRQLADAGDVRNAEIVANNPTRPTR